MVEWLTGGIGRLPIVSPDVCDIGCPPIWSRADGKAGMLLERGFRFVDPADFGPPRAFPEMTGQLGKLIGIAGRVDFNAAIIQIANVSMDAKRMGGALDKVAKTDALYLAADTIQAGEFPCAHFAFVSG